MLCKLLITSYYLPTDERLGVVRVKVTGDSSIQCMSEYSTEQTILQ